MNIRAGGWLRAAALGSLALGLMVVPAACSDDDSESGTTGGSAGATGGTGGKGGTGGADGGTGGAGGSAGAKKVDAGPDVVAKKDAGPDVSAPDASVSLEAGSDAKGSLEAGADASPEAAPDAGTVATPDAAPDAPRDAATSADLTPIIVPVSPDKHDRLYGVTFDATGNIFATGQVALAGTDGGVDDYAFFVVKFLATGVVDTTFGANGVAVKNVAVGGGSAELPRGIVIQSTGKIVIAGTVEHNVNAPAPASSDRDIALVRFNANGSIDNGFGTGGVVTLNLNDGVETRTTTADGGVNVGWAGADSQWSLSVFPDDKLLVHGNQRAEGFIEVATDGGTEGGLNLDGGAEASDTDAAPRSPRTDTDWALVRLSADGAYDDTFGTHGKFTLDIGKVSGSARSATILADGKIVAGGYATTAQVGNTGQPVLYRVTSDGKLDTTFGVQGVFHQVVLGTQTEAYGAKLQGNKFVTVGYGRDTTTQTTDIVSLRLGPTGLLDTTWGTSGIARFDVAGYADNGRDLVVLGDQRVLLIGGGRPTSSNVDGFLGMLTVNGAPDTAFSPTGFKTVDLGGPNDFLWAGAVARDGKKVAIVGLKGVATGADAGAVNDDSALVIFDTSR